MTLKSSAQSLVGIVLLVVSPAWCAAITLAPVFSDHMVLQREREMPIWGTAAAGEKVTVEYAGKKAEATADEKGDWMAKLPPLKPGNATTLKVSGEKSGEPVLFNDVLVGDVWICSG